MRESNMLSIWRMKWSSITKLLFASKWMTIVSHALETLTNMSATARLQTKKYMGEWRFLFFTMARMTRMFSRRLMSPSVRKTSGAMCTCSQADEALDLDLLDSLLWFVWLKEAFGENVGHSEVFMFWCRMDAQCLVTGDVRYMTLHPCTFAVKRKSC